MATPGPGQRAGAGVGVVVVVERPERRELRLRLGEQLERRLGRDAQRALVAHEQVLELVAAGGLADLAADAVADVQDLAGGQHVVEAEHQVAGVPVAGADQRPAAGADPAADQRARVGRRVVGIEQPVLGQPLVQLEHADAGADRDGAVDQVELVDLVHPLDVDDDAAAQRHGAVGQPGAAVARDDGIAQVVGDPHDRGDLLGGGRQHRRGRAPARTSGAPGTAPARGPGCTGRSWTVRICSSASTVRSAAPGCRAARRPGARCRGRQRLVVMVSALRSRSRRRSAAAAEPPQRRLRRCAPGHAGPLLGEPAVADLAPGAADGDAERLGEQLVDVDHVDVLRVAGLAERALRPRAGADQRVDVELARPAPAGWR